MTEETPEPNNLLTRNPKTAYLTFVTTGFLALCNLIRDETLKKVFITISPSVTAGSSWVLTKASNYLYNTIKYKRSLKAYRKIIANLQGQLKKPGIKQPEINRINKQIEKYNNDINDLEIKNIKVF